MLKNLNKVKQKGQAIIIAALGLVGVAGMGAIVVDVGSVYVQASQFQSLSRQLEQAHSMETQVFTQLIKMVITLQKIQIHITSLLM